MKNLAKSFLERVRWAFPPFKGGARRVGGVSSPWGGARRAEGVLRLYLILICTLLFAPSTYAQINPSTLPWITSPDDNMYTLLFDPDLALSSQTNRVSIATLDSRYLIETPAILCSQDFIPTEIDSTNVDSHSFLVGFYTSSNGNVTLSLSGNMNPTASGAVYFHFSLPFTSEQTVGDIIGSGYANSGGGEILVDLLSGGNNARLIFPNNTATAGAYYSATVTYTTADPDADCTIDGISISGTPEALDFARFTDASTIEGRSYAEMRADLNLVVGVDIQPYDIDLSAIAGLPTASDRLPYYTGAGTAALATFTGTARNLLDDASVSAMRTTLDVDQAGTDNSTDVTLAGAPDYLTIAGQVITRGLIDLTTDVTGVLPDGGFAKTGDWTGTFDGQQGTWYQDRANHTGTQTLSTISDAGTLAGLSTINNTNWSGTDLSVANGGSGRSSATAYAVITGGTTSTGAHQSVSGVGTSGQVLTSNGASALPTWQNASTSAGGSNTQLQYNNAGALAGMSQFIYNGTNIVAGAGTFVLPASPSTTANGAIRYDNSNNDLFQIYNSTTGTWQEMTPYPVHETRQLTTTFTNSQENFTVENVPGIARIRILIYEDNSNYYSAEYSILLLTGTNEVVTLLYPEVSAGNGTSYTFIIDKIGSTSVRVFMDNLTTNSKDYTVQFTQYFEN